MFLNKQQNWILIALGGVLSLSLTSCDSTKEALGLKRNQPDEFSVVQTAPLTLPPNFDELPTPEPGADRPQEPSAKEKARQAVLADTDAAEQKPFNQSSDSQSAGEEAVLQKAGAEERNPEIRQQVDKEANIESAQQESVIQKIVSFGKNQKGKVIDPVEENRRLNQEDSPSVQP